MPPPLPLGEYLKRVGGLPQSRRTLPPRPLPWRPPPPQRPFPQPRSLRPPGAGDVALRAALRVAPKALSFAVNPGVGGGVGLGLTALGTALGASGGNEDAVKAVGAASAVAPIATDLAMTGSVGLMSLWNLPSMANSLHKLIEGNEADVRRAKRTNDAKRLAGRIVGPLGNVQSPEDLSDAMLATDVGGASLGDSLASMLRFNLNGTWFTDTDHGWLPDPSYGPLLRRLEALGYTGTEVKNGEIIRREPTLRDVGGVGEIVAGAGPSLIPRDMVEAYEDDFARQRNDENGPTPTGTYAGRTGAAAGALGFEGLLRRVAGVKGLPSRVTPRWGSQPWDPQPTDMAAQDEGGAMVPSRYETPQAWTDYLASLEAFDPALAARVRAGVAAIDANRSLDQRGIGEGPVGAVGDATGEGEAGDT